MLLEIQNLRCLSGIGKHEWEKSVLQTLVISIKIDHYSFLDYSNVREKIKDFCLCNRFDYIEELASSIMKLIKSFFDINHCRISISKPSAFGYLTSDCPSVEVCC